MLNSIPNFRWCLRPGCEAGQIHDINEDSPIFICCDTTCGYKFCVNHSIPWHEDETCAEYDYRTVGKFKDDAASEESIKKLCKRCAKCESPIEKHKGCDHMTCFKCKYEFCWICLVPWDNIRERDDAGHESHCKNYRAPRQRPGVPPLIPPPNQNGRVYEMPAPNFEGYGMRTPGEYARDPYLIREPGRDRVGGPDAELNQIRMRVRERSRETYHRNRH
ncbi:hypothetical protein BGZ60DRAFT_415842 [Tricladium varicosporioides]|nr:hypothetical protein BGZ60DRAFT_415842 [Hymenoscyphus varicosporioides]